MTVSSHMDRVEEQLDRYMAAPTWFQTYGKDNPCRIAYFSAEFGIHESIRFIRGLGVLSGRAT